MGIEGYISHKIDSDKLKKIVHKEISKYSNYSFIKDEMKHVNIAFNDKIPNGDWKSFTLPKLNDNLACIFFDEDKVIYNPKIKNHKIPFKLIHTKCYKPIIHRTPYEISENQHSVIAKNLNTGISYIATRINFELNGFSEDGFTFRKTEGAPALWYQIEKGNGNIKKSPPIEPNLEVINLEQLVKGDSDRVIYMDNLMVPADLTKIGFKTTPKKNYTLSYNVSGGIVTDGFFGEILDGKQSHIFDVKSKKEIRKGWTFNYVEVCLTGVVVYTTCNYFALLGLMDYMEDR